MKKRANNYAFVDTQNLFMWAKSDGWIVDWRKVRNYLKHRFDVSKAYLFIWYLEEQEDMYEFMESCWFELIHKPVSELKWETKWNVDAELVLQAMIDYEKYDKAVIVTWDGDFTCLVRHLESKKKLLRLLVPTDKWSSRLLKEASNKKITTLSRMSRKLAYKKRSSKKKMKEAIYTP